MACVVGWCLMASSIPVMLTCSDCSCLVHLQLAPCTSMHARELAPCTSMHAREVGVLQGHQQRCSGRRWKSQPAVGGRRSVFKLGASTNAEEHLLCKSWFSSTHRKFRFVTRPAASSLALLCYHLNSLHFPPYFIWLLGHSINKI